MMITVIAIIRRTITILVSNLVFRSTVGICCRFLRINVETSKLVCHRVGSAISFRHRLPRRLCLFFIDDWLSWLRLVVEKQGCEWLESAWS